ncbi:hypothetical protein AVEN_263-1 [Araneus ventricosus]|uniref:Histone-lysine N-methyltransferase SETMAR n=1 Tax=Araneus ventricosus TaxID=182803 RepID=A0A4Y2CPE8_ARAVE|nr:hypothetical protein AVEN_263-1 [Araneus ventricosus]
MIILYCSQDSRIAAKVEVGSLEPSPPPYSPDMAPNLGSKHLSGTRFFSNSDVKTAVENWLDMQGRDFYQAVVLRLDKCLNIFDDYVET